LSCQAIQLVFAIKLVPQTTVHESLTTEYLSIVSWAVVIFVATLAKELLKVLSVEVKGGLTA
jgi:hypothetical protein